jgi:hypothetical protein
MDSLRFTVHVLPGLPEIAASQQIAGQQPDNLCGPYWVSVLLRSRGISVTPETVAQRAGTRLPIGDSRLWLPAGALSKQDDTVPLPRTDRLENAGTAAIGLMQAVATLSQDQYCLLPLQAPWSAEQLWALLHLCRQQPDWAAVPLCNLKTGWLWGSGLALPQAMAYLGGEDITPPPADWNVGHFLILAGLVEGAARSLLWVGDTYPLFGWQGYHLQPPTAVAQALNRNDGAGGGVFLFIATHHRSQVEQQVRALGFHVEVWDNGTPMMPTD